MSKLEVTDNDNSTIEVFSQTNKGENIESPY